MSVSAPRELPPADGREAAAAVLRVLHGLAPPQQLSALALAGRILRAASPEEGASAERLPILPHQVWVSPVMRSHSRKIIGREGEEVTYMDRRRIRKGTVPEFRTWVRATGARPI